ncbi:hypothetical protein [Williamsia muralis]|uniref:Uncharacterized protein n=1 Tax=Williamsia marianensis TaxID=85044 RepID=A0ABU4F0P9_WILMA|nr:hypothetical protein [Williamsia muralis]MDV7137077.1 hypothetical protein [Williamsia muralis]
MRYPDACSAFDHYDEVRDPDDHEIDRVVPADPGDVHAVIGGHPRTAHEAHILERWEHERAACGRRMRVMLPVDFNAVDPDACPRCVREMARRAEDPAAWQAEQRRRYVERQTRDREAYDYEDHKAREFLREQGRDADADRIV